MISLNELSLGRDTSGPYEISSKDLEWLIRRFREMHEIIRDTPIYQEILREGWEEG